MECLRPTRTRTLARTDTPSLPSLTHSERAWVDSDIASVRVKVIVETADKLAGAAMFETLGREGYMIESLRTPTV